jgi:NAD(P)-dependent dehydrogenase (short-subunit alcohol dehydrogenase family)
VAALDAVVVCAGDGKFAPLAQLTDADFAFALKSKLMGQVNVARAAFERLTDRGSVTLTTGVLSRQPIPGGATYSLVNGGVEAFARAAALEAPRGIRINVVSPPWIKETLRALGRDDSTGLAAADVARTYATAVTGKQSGEVLDPARFG